MLVVEVQHPARSARAMWASRVFTCRISNGSLTRGMKMPPSCGSEMVPMTWLRESVAGRIRMSWRSIEFQRTRRSGIRPGHRDDIGHHEVPDARGEPSLR